MKVKDIITDAMLYDKPKRAVAWDDPRKPQDRVKPSDTIRGKDEILRHREVMPKAKQSRDWLQAQPVDEEHNQYHSEYDLENDELDKIARRATRRRNEQPMDEESLDNTLNMTAMEESINYDSILSSGKALAKIDFQALREKYNHSKDHKEKAAIKDEILRRRNTLSTQLTRKLFSENKPFIAKYGRGQVLDAITEVVKNAEINTITNHYINRCIRDVLSKTMDHSGMNEGSMADAEHDQSGAHFGGYWGAEDKGPPKRTQGAGGGA